jgi:hypothetical protein
MDVVFGEYVAARSRRFEEIKTTEGLKRFEQTTGTATPINPLDPWGIKVISTTFILRGGTLGLATSHRPPVDR